MAYTYSAENGVITVNAAITIYGPGANAAIAATWQRWISNLWNKNPGYGKCKVIFNVQITADPKATHWYNARSDPNFGSNEQNYLFVPHGIGDPHVDPLGFTGTIPDATLSFSVAHELGHLLSLWDARPGFLLPWRDPTDIMAEGTVVTEYDIEGILGAYGSALAESQCGCKGK